MTVDTAGSPRSATAGVKAVCAAASAAIAVAQVAMHAGLYWARVQTFVVSPGRFKPWEVILGSDAIVFAFPMLATVLGTYFVWYVAGSRSHPVRVLLLAGCLALVGAYIAFFIAFNRWGT